MNNLFMTKDLTDQFDPEDVKNHQMMGVLSYISWLVFFPIFCARDSAYARFHANQGLVLAITGTVMSLLLKILGKLPLVGWIFRFCGSGAGIVCLALSIIGILNAIHMKAKELPIIGQFRILK